jgi:hypothetical protein
MWVLGLRVLGSSWFVGFLFFLGDMVVPVYLWVPYFFFKYIFITYKKYIYMKQCASVLSLIR